MTVLSLDLSTSQALLAGVSIPPLSYLVGFHLTYFVVAVVVALVATPITICMNFILSFLLHRLGPHLPELLDRMSLWKRFGFYWPAGDTPETFVVFAWSLPILVSNIVALIVLLVRTARLMVVVKRGELKKHLAAGAAPLKTLSASSLLRLPDRVSVAMQRAWLIFLSLWTSDACLSLNNESHDVQHTSSADAGDHSNLDYSRHGYNWHCPEMDPFTQSPVHIPEELLSCDWSASQSSTVTSGNRLTRPGGLGKSSLSMSTASDSASSDLGEWPEDHAGTKSRSQGSAAASHSIPPTLKLHTSALRMPLHRSSTEIKVADASLAQNKLILDGKELSLAQFHFHSPAEHLILRPNFGPVRMDAEIHFVFADQSGSPRAVIGYILEATPTGDNQLLQGLLDPSRQTDDYMFENGIIAAVANSNSFESLPFVSYDGSLTTPPCSGPISWFVGHSTMSPAQSKRLMILQENGHGGNWRAAQEMFCRRFSQVDITCAAEHSH